MHSLGVRVKESNTGFMHIQENNQGCDDAEKLSPPSNLQNQKSFQYSYMPLFLYAAISVTLAENLFDYRLFVKFFVWFSVVFTFVTRIAASFSLFFLSPRFLWWHCQAAPMPASLLRPPLISRSAHDSFIFESFCLFVIWFLVLATRVSSIRKE